MSDIIRPKKRHTVRRLLWTFAIIAALVAALTFTIVLRLRPMVRPVAIARAKSVAARAINDAVDEVLAGKAEVYGELISLDKDSDNRVTALRTKTVEINRLKAELSSAVLERVAGIDSAVISIPIGNVINSEFFSGMGPRIYITLMPVGFVETDIVNSFTAAGINQTRHQILLDVTATIGIVMPTYTEYASVSTSVILGESVLLGSVPESYTNVSTDEQLWDKINNFLELG